MHALAGKRVIGGCSVCHGTLECLLKQTHEESCSEFDFYFERRCQTATLSGCLVFNQEKLVILTGNSAQNVLCIHTLVQANLFVAMAAGDKRT